MVLGAFGEQPRVLVTLFDTQSLAVPTKHALTQLLKLTPREADVAIQMATGKAAGGFA